MNDYFYLEWSSTGKDSTGVAYAPEECPLDHELINIIQGKSELPFELNLKTVIVTKKGIVSKELNLVEGAVVDYQPNSLAWPLMSEKMKQIVDYNLTGDECIDWVSVKIRILENLVSYYIPRFNKELDVLDKEKTIFVPETNHIIESCLSYNKIKSYHLFPEPRTNDLWRISPNLFLSEKLKKALQKEKIKGVIFVKAKVTK